MKKPIAILFFLVFATFWLLDGFAISTGDDLGYMFTDARLHDGSGNRVQSFSDCFRTQLSHYQTTNGRFLVHLATQTLLSLTPPWVFRLLNSLMFAFLWLFSVRLTGLGRCVWGAMLVLLLLWIGLPAPGINLLGLVAIAVNYLWTGVFCLAFLLLWQRLRDKRLPPWLMTLLALFSLLTGSLQESFGIPLAAGLFIWLLMHHRTLRDTGVVMCVAFMLGVIVEAVAPGNLNHLDTVNSGQAGLLHKIWLVLKELPVTPVALLLLTLILMIIKNGWKSLWCFLLENIVLAVAIIAAIGFAMLAFTSTRQLFAPCIFSIILAVSGIKALFGGVSGRLVRYAGIASAVVLAILLTSVYIIRENTHRQWQRFLASYQEQVHQGARTVFTDVSEYNFNRYPGMTEFLKRYDADPMGGLGISLFFDFYTKRGLSRLYAPGKQTITHLIPYPATKVKDVATGTEKPDAEGLYTPAPLDERFAVIRVPRGRKAIPTYPSGGTVPYEEFDDDNWHYLVIAGTDTLKYTLN